MSLSTSDKAKLAAFKDKLIVLGEKPSKVKWVALAAVAAFVLGAILL